MRAHGARRGTAGDGGHRVEEGRHGAVSEPAEGEVVDDRGRLGVLQHAGVGQVVGEGAQVDECFAQGPVVGGGTVQERDLIVGGPGGDQVLEYAPVAGHAERVELGGAQRADGAEPGHLPSGAECGEEFAVPDGGHVVVAAVDQGDGGGGLALDEAGDASASGRWMAAYARLVQEPFGQAVPGGADEQVERAGRGLGHRGSRAWAARRGPKRRV